MEGRFRHLYEIQKTMIERNFNEDRRRKLIEFTSRNKFVQTCGIEIRELEYDNAVLSVNVHPELLNPMGMVHGGLLYTMADCCSGIAARTDGRLYVTQNGSMNYFRNVSEGTVLAKGQVLHRGRTVCTVNVKIYSAEQNKLLADATFDMFSIKHPTGQ